MAAIANVAPGDIVNYRTSHQIRQQADRLLDPEITDMDEVREDRGDIVSVFNGPVPRVRSFATAEAEVKAVATWLGERAAEGLEPHEIGVFVRSEAQVERARQAMELAGTACRELNAQVEVVSGYAAIGVMHVAKPRDWSSARWPSWLVTTKCCRFRSGSSRLS